MTAMDPRNPVVRLCGEGMRAETEGRADAARELFARAWEAATDDYEKCVAAHYVARHQPTPEETLRWNQECLDRADLGHTGEARQHYERAAAHIESVPPGPYGDALRAAVTEGLRIAETGPEPTP